jgi:ribosomal protein S18 acetylase RimI-like enzyme
MIRIQKVTLAEAEQLLAFSKKTFHHFFAPLNEPANIEAYSAMAFTMEKMRSELINSDSEFYFAMVGDTIAGYLKLNFGNTQTEFQDGNAVEVERIYVSEEHHGSHIGRQLLNFAVEKAKSKQLSYVWLGVWEHNYKAIGFYEHHGFDIFGSHEFLLGNDLQTDLLMKRIMQY